METIYERLLPQGHGIWQDAARVSLTFTKDYALVVWDLFDSGYQTISVVEYGMKGWASLKGTVEHLRHGKCQAAAKALTDTAIAVSLAVGFIFWFHQAHIANCAIGLYDNVHALALNTFAGNHSMMNTHLVGAAVCLTYLLAEVLVGPVGRLMVTSSLTVLEVCRAQLSLAKGNELTSMAFLTRAVIRVVLGRKLPLQAYQHIKTTGRLHALV